MKVLITGATGLVGSGLTNSFVESGHQVKVLIRQGADRSLLGSSIGRIEVIEGDVLDVLLLQQAIKDVDCVIHAAGVVSFSPRDRDRMFKVNQEGTANIVNACLNNSVRLGYISSIAAIGRPEKATSQSSEPIVIDEENHWVDSSANSQYAKSKYLGELEVWRGIEEGLSAFILNPSIILGAGDLSKSSTRLVKYVMDENPFYSLGIVNYVDLNDLIRVTRKILDAGISGERFIVSGGYTTYQKLFTVLAEAFDKKPPRWPVKQWMASIIWRLEAVRTFVMGGSPLITKESSRSALLRIQYSNEKIQNVTGLKFKSLNETARTLAESFKL